MNGGVKLWRWMVAGRRGEEDGRGNKVSLLIAAAHTAGMFPISLVCTWNCICKIRGAISLFLPILIVCVCVHSYASETWFPLRRRNVVRVSVWLEISLHWLLSEGAAMGRSCQKEKMNPSRDNTWSGVRVLVFKWISANLRLTVEVNRIPDIQRRHSCTIILKSSPINPHDYCHPDSPASLVWQYNSK